MSKPYTPIVIDLETTATCNNAQILSIGAAAGDGSFFSRNGIICNSAMYRTDAATLEWWSKQDPEVRAASFAEDYSLRDVLEDLAAFISTARNPLLFGNAARFDLGILENAYRVEGVSVPWNYRQEADYRTIKTLFRSRYTEPKFRGKQHIAVNDAEFELACLKEFYERFKFTYLVELPLTFEGFNYASRDAA